MAHPMTVRLQHDSDHVAVFREDPRCEWPDCINRVRWNVIPRRRLPGLHVPGEYFCTAHARAVIKRIEDAARHSPPPDQRAEGQG